MAKKIIILLIVLLLPVLHGSAQSLDSLHRSHYSFNVGTGWTHYFNSLEVGAEKVHPDKIGFSFRFFWEPGYRVSIGLESGYYRVYRFTDNDKEQEIHIDQTAIPLMLVARMRVINRFHLSVATGLALMDNAQKLGKDKKTERYWSLSNYEFSGSYIYPLGKHFRISGEAGVYTFGKTEDWMMYVQGVFSVVL